MLNLANKVINKYFKMHLGVHYRPPAKLYQSNFDLHT